MSKSIIVSERDNIAAVMKGEKAVEFFIHRGDMLLGDVYLASVENILPSIDAAFVNLGGDRMGFLHASDITGKGALKDRLKPKQQLLVQIMKEPTGHKGPRVTTSVSLPGRFLVFMPDEKGISVSRKILSVKERGRLKSIVSLIKPAGVGVIIRTEAEGQSEAEIQEDLELLLERWNNIVTAADTVTPPNLLYRDQDLLYRIIREACTEEIKEIVLDTSFALHRTNQLLQSWNIGHSINTNVYKGSDPLLVAKGIDKEIRLALQAKVNLPSGGYLYIQNTEALTVIDVNSGKFTSSATQKETIKKTNLEAVVEISRQLKLRNIGGMIIIDFIDMENRVDQLAILEELELVLEPDKAKPQIGQLSDLGLVELTRHRQGQSLAEIFTKKCPACSGTGLVVDEFNFALPPQEGEFRMRSPKLKMPQKATRINSNNSNQKPSFDIAQTINTTEEKSIAQRKIKTLPSLVASVAQRQKKSEESEVKISDLSEETTKKFLNVRGYVPNMSKVIKFSALPPKVAREHMGEDYVMDVFSILQELESTAYIAPKQMSLLPKNNIIIEQKSAKIEPPKSKIPVVENIKEDVVKNVEPLVEEQTENHSKKEENNLTETEKEEISKTALKNKKGRRPTRTSSTTKRTTVRTPNN
ncbi:MAG: Rne/Rng family ribonuclease [bacterium]